MRSTKIQIAVLALISAGVAGCGGASEESVPAVALNHNAPVVTFTPGADEVVVDGKPTAPISIRYRIIGTPVVGQPVAVDVQVTSDVSAQPVSVGYRINDATAMRLGDSQPDRVAFAPSAQSKTASQQVTIVPLREGRLYLNVSASIDTESGSMSTVTAIPIQVGEGGRSLEQNGTVTTDENGEAIRVLPAKGD